MFIPRYFFVFDTTSNVIFSCILFLIVYYYCIKKWQISVLTLYPATLFNSYISSNRYLVEKFGFSMYTVAYVHTQLLQLCLTLWNPVDCSLPGSCIYGILQARILEWAAIPFSSGPFWPRERTYISCIEGWLFSAEPLGKPQCHIIYQ